jgi:hypothetical protein
MRVPKPTNGGKARSDYVEVDPSRLCLEMLTQLWTRDRDSRDPSSRWMPLGSQLIDGKNFSFDVTEVVERLERSISELKAQLKAVGSDEAKRMSQDILEPLMALSEVFRLIGSGQVPLAANKTTEVIMDLSGNLQALAWDMNQNEAYAAGMEAYGDHVNQEAEKVLEVATQKIRKAQLLNEDTYLEWAGAAEKVLDAVRSLEPIEQKLEMMATQCVKELSEWQAKLASDSVQLKEDKLFLETDWAYDAKFFLMSPDKSQADAIHEKLLRVRGIIRKWSTRLEEAEKARETLSTAARQEVYKQRAVVTTHCSVLIKYSPILGDWHRKHEKQGLPLPCDMYDGLIPKEDYDQAIVYNTDARWGPRNTEKRLLSLLARVESSADTRLKLDIQLAKARTAADEVEAALRAIEGPPAVSSPASTLPARSAETRITPVNGTKASSPAKRDDKTAESRDTLLLSSERAEEIYEMMICIGYVVTMGSAFLSNTQVTPALEMLVLLQKITETEVSLYKEAVRELSKGPGQREQVKSSKRVISRAKQSNHRWIHYKIAKNWVLRITHRSAPYCESLLKKHALTEDAIRAARAKRREIKDDEYDSRNEGSS